MLSKINELIFWKIFKYDDDKILMMDKMPFVMLPARAVAKFVQTLSEDLGVDDTARIGYDSSLVAADDIINAFGWAKTNLPGKMNMMMKMFSIMGFGEFDIKIWNAEERKILGHITRNPVFEWGEKLYGEKQLITPFYMGIVSAHLHKEMGIENCWLIETQSIPKGDKFYEWSYNVFNNEEKKP